MGAGQKARVRALLRDRDIRGIERWADTGRRVLETLFSLTYDADALIAHRAVEAIGRAAARVAATREDKVRDFIRRLLWLMNDESGGIGWRAPEAIGEILVNRPDLAEVFGPILAGFLDESPFERGAHAALARLGRTRPDAIVAASVRLRESLTSQDPAIRAFAFVALEAAGHASAALAKPVLAADRAELCVYDYRTGELGTVTVGAYIAQGSG